MNATEVDITGVGTVAVNGSVTVTPSYQKGGFFLRGDLAFVHLGSLTPGDGFGSLGLNTNQTRAMAEIGFIFGNNITEKK